MRFSWSDRRHWTIEVGRVWVQRWCGQPHADRHPVRAGLYRRAWSRRYDDPPINGIR